MARVAPSDLREVVAKAPAEGEEENEAQALSLRAYPFRPYLQGSSLAIDPQGDNLYALDDDAGELVVVDAVKLTEKRRTKICDRPEQLVVGADQTAFATCRGDGKVVAVRGGRVVASTFIGDEPYGIAMTPTGRSVLVTTTVAPRIVSLRTTDLGKVWERDLPAEPRGLAISADGRRATVAHLMGGIASVIDVQRGFAGRSTLPSLRDGWPSELFEDADLDFERRVAGGAFAVAASPGGTRAFVPYILKNNGSKITEFAPGCYANGADIPVAASVAAIDFKTGQVQRPAPVPLTGDDVQYADFSGVSALGTLGVVRAAVHDPKHARLFAAGEGSGTVLGFDTSKADPTSNVMWQMNVDGPVKGLTVDPGGTRLFVHLALQDEIQVLPLGADAVEDRMVLGDDDGETPEELGRRLFYSTRDGKISGFQGVSCNSCHLDGRSDGVTWRLDGKPLQTPSLAGRRFNAKTLRWHGDSPSLEHAVGEAITRLGGSGLSAGENKALAAFLRSGEAEMERPMLNASRARGQRVFDDAGCTSCHTPTTDYTDGQMHTFREQKVRTPSLIGVALSAPYYHDGSVATLGQLIRSHEENNPMAVGKELSDDDLVDLERFLKSL